MRDLRLIEHGFPCHQVGAETRRERNASSALPPLYFLHVWWARRPLTPSRAAILASLLPADTNADEFVRELGIERTIADVRGQPWSVAGKLRERVEYRNADEYVLVVDAWVQKAFQKEVARRAECRRMIQELREADDSFEENSILGRWEDESTPFNVRTLEVGEELPVRFVAGDPSHINERLNFAKDDRVVQVLGGPIRWAPEDLYGYNRAYERPPTPVDSSKVVLDPTAGGGSIPFEALRLGHQVIANELNPVASVILKATLEYSAKFGTELVDDIQSWGDRLIANMQEGMEGMNPFSPLPESEREYLRKKLKSCPEIFEEFAGEEIDQQGLLFCRQVTSPHNGGEAPLLNTCWLSKEEGEPWAVRIVTHGDGAVSFEPYRLKGGKGPNGEDPNFSTVSNGVGVCPHTRQAIDGDEIKRQARGESPYGKWRDRLYCVVAVRREPVLDNNGKPQRYKSGEKKGRIKTKKIRFFRPPNERDLAALDLAEKRLREKWDAWEAAGLIPTEKIPEGDKTREPQRYGMTHWCDLFTPRQLLGHVTLVEELNRLKPKILKELGEEKGKAIITYLQFAIDKGVDYNSRQTRWEFTRGIVKGTFGRHDFSLKWTFGEMIFTGTNSGAQWGLSQILDAYQGIAKLVEPLREKRIPNLRVLNNTAANLGAVDDESVDLVCMDPPYYNNVQYSELSDYFYVWMRRTLKDLYPDSFTRRLTNKTDEAVANPARDGTAKKAKDVYQTMMGEIFGECRRVLKDDGIFTLMFTHKSQEAWETLTRSLIESGWTITSSFPVDSESSYSTHQMDMASAASSIFIACRKRPVENREPATWTGFGGTGVAARIREAVREGLEDFVALRLNPVDEMVASYGRALRVLSEQWPVLDGDEPVGPVRAMLEASRVVAENQIHRLTGGRLSVTDLSGEASMALTLFGIFGLAQFPYDEALSLSKSLNIRLEAKPAGYTPGEQMIGINQESGGGRAKRSRDEDRGYFAPLVRKGSKLRLVPPEERNPKRLEQPRTEWDVLHGLIVRFREGDVPVARAYLDEHAAGKEALYLDLLTVWEKEIPDPNLKSEARAIRFGLKGSR